MTISIAGAQISETATISGNTVTTVFTAVKRTTIVAICVCPTTGTPNLSISRYNGTTRIYRRKAVAMTAGTAFVYDTPFSLNPGDLLEVTSSSATGDMDVEVTYVTPDAAALSRG